jgi:ubiquinone/menaquinone biosynthesis C-methylase UbiE
MKLNRIETWAMNNPLRAAIQRRYEAPHLARLAPKALAGATTLIVGCGRGIDVRIAFDQFGVGAVTAFDLDEAQVARARRILGDRYGERLRLQTADAAALPFGDATFDLALDFAIIHHVPEWQNAVREVARVLKPGGQFLFEEFSKRALDSLLFRIFTDHPRDNRFTPEQFGAECEAAGLALAGPIESLPGFFRGCAVKAANRP